MELNVNQFFTFLAIYAANADAEIDQQEVNLIVKDAGEDLYSEMRTLFDKLSDKERLEIITANSTYYNTEESKAKLFERMIRVFKVDGHINASESAVIRLLKHLL
ncbi:TerB family tellurite resistance protein [Flavobacteriales bacterium]|jgi:uncharacterized membrane protein YebE (DUF533 family)|nr:TerB family tellurite resistance protein [Flavobacteriales bacterium]